MWAHLDASTYSLSEVFCEKLVVVLPFSVTLNGLKLACRTIQGCNVIQFDPKNSNYQYFKCPIPLPLSSEPALLEIHAYGESKSTFILILETNHHNLSLG